MTTGAAARPGDHVASRAAPGRVGRVMVVERYRDGRDVCSIYWRDGSTSREDARDLTPAADERKEQS